MIRRDSYINHWYWQKKNYRLNKLNRNDSFLMEPETSFDILRVMLVGIHIVIFLKRKYLKDERCILCMIQKALRH